MFQCSRGWFLIQRRKQCQRKSPCLFCVKATLTYHAKSLHKEQSWCNTALIRSLITVCLQLLHPTVIFTGDLCVPSILLFCILVLPKNLMHTLFPDNCRHTYFDEENTESEAGQNSQFRPKILYNNMHNQETFKQCRFMNYVWACVLP